MGTNGLGEERMKRPREMRLFVYVAVLGMILVATGGCRSHKGPVVEPNLSTDSGLDSSGPEETLNPNGLPNIDQDSILWDRFQGLQPVHFDYDSYGLRSDARAVLKENAAKILQVPGVMVQIEGHCDERGTQEYNFVLGEKRALATREYLINLGVSGDRLVTISYGEEDPVDPGHTESAWAKNRRCEFNRGRR